MINFINYLTLTKHLFCILTVCCLGISQLYGNIIKLDLDGDSNCNGQLSVEIYIKASNNADVDHFGVGSGTLFLNYNSDIITYNSYQTAEFSANTSTQAKAAKWINQSWKVNNSNGLMNIVLHREEGGNNHYILNKSTWLYIGTITFDWVGNETNPEIRLNSLLSLFNAPVNDGLYQLILEDYPTVNDWDDCNAFCASETPEISGITTYNATCGALENDGEITISFPNHPTRTHLEFSIDGGATFPYRCADYIGSYTIPNLFDGVYEMFIRWGNDACPTELGDVNLNPSPVVTKIWHHNTCANANTGRLKFSFPDYPDRTSITFSIDGGATYPYSTADNVGHYFITNLPAGTYDLWARWGAADCAVDLPDRTIETDQLVPATAAVKRHSCFEDGQILLTFSNTPIRTGVEFSINGGTSYPYSAPDNAGQLIINNLAPGTYDVWARWGDNDCPVAVNTITIDQLDLPQASTTITDYSCDNGPNVNAILTFSFANSSERTHIEFSLDGGATYPYYFADNIGSADIPVSAGTYDVWVRWGNNACPVDLPDITIEVLEAPLINTISTIEQCQGSIVVTFPDHPTRTALQLSIDGGLTYPYQFADNIGTYTIEGLSSGTYDLFVSWGNNNCPVSLPNQQITINNPVICSGFEEQNQSFATFQQSTNDDLNWRINQGGTTSGNTGPSTAIEGNYYIYIEATNNFNKTSDLYTDCFTLTDYTNPVLSFYYHMYGLHMGSLEIDLWDANTNQFLATIFSRSGNQGNAWYEHTFDLSPWANDQVYLKIKGITGPSFTSDIALDDFCIHSNVEPSCATIDTDGFESTGAFWQRSGGTTSYLFNNSSYSVTGDKCWLIRGNNGNNSSLVSHTTDFSSYSGIELSFDYKIVNQFEGNTLELEISTDDGVNYQSVDNLQYGIDYLNDYTEVYNAWFTIDNVIFTPQTKLRLRSASISDFSYFFIDNVEVKGCSIPLAKTKGRLTAPSSNDKTKVTATPDVFHIEEPVKIFPNPATKEDLLIVETGLEEIMEYSVFDSNGSLVTRVITSDNHLTLDATQFTSGVFILQIKTKSGLKAKKFVVIE